MGFLLDQPYFFPYLNHFKFLDGNLSNICLKSHAEVVIAATKCNGAHTHMAATPASEARTAGSSATRGRVGKVAARPGGHSERE